jgi:hypothetical protein
MMADDVRFTLETRDFEYAAQRLGHYSKREADVFLKEQIRGFIRHIMDMTPPTRGSRTGTKAKKAGEQAVTADVRAVFRAVSKPDKAEVRSISEMKSVMRSRRGGSTMRVRTSGNKVAAPRALITELIKLKKQRVGYLASAWAVAARSIGKIRIPAWINRHSAPGGTRISRNGDIITASITNAVSWASDIEGLNRRVGAALRAQTRSMEKRLGYFYANIRNKAGWKG